MTAASRKGHGLIVLGLILMIAGAVFLAVGTSTPIGTSQLAVGVVFLAIGMAANRKANAAP
jgi:hypothetical protein